MPITLLLWTAGIVVALFVIPWLIGIRYIPHNKVGIVEKFWSHRGSLTEGRIVALNGEAGFQAELLRGGLHAAERVGAGVGLGDRPRANLVEREEVGRPPLLLARVALAHDRPGREPDADAHRGHETR